MGNVLSASFKWRDRDGSRSEFRIDGPVEWDAAFALARKMGWPGHRGRVIDYLKDDLRKLWLRLVARP